MALSAPDTDSETADDVSLFPPRVDESAPSADRDPPSARSRPDAVADWSRVTRQGLGLWAGLAAGFLALPAGHPAEVGLAVSSLLAAPTVPVGLYFSRGDAIRNRLGSLAATATGAGGRVLAAGRALTDDAGSGESGCTGCCC